MSPAYPSWYLCGILAVGSFLISSVTVIPGRGNELVRDAITAVGALGSVAFGCFALYVRSRPVHHWVYQSTVLAGVLVGVGIVATIALYLITVG